jgi:hypothetical protein
MACNAFRGSTRHKGRAKWPPHLCSWLCGCAQLERSASFQKLQNIVMVSVHCLDLHMLEKQHGLHAYGAELSRTHIASDVSKPLYSEGFWGLRYENAWHTIRLNGPPNRTGVRTLRR